MGSISGSVAAAFVVAIGQEWLRVLDGPLTIGPFRTDGITVPLIEQNAHGARKAVHYGYVLETGEITLAEPGGELPANESVREAYLGKARS